MWLTVVRDLAIVLLALETIVIGILLALMLLQLRKLVSLLRDEVKPMLEEANRTVNTVHGTASFLSKTLVEPVIKVSSFSTGTLQALRSLLFIRRKIRGPLGGDEDSGL
jgi:hypothetical protein